MVERILLPLLLVGTACIATACTSDTTDCASSPPLVDGDSAAVKVVVVTKPGLGVNVIGSIDVNDGLYGTPQKAIVDGDPTGTASVTDLPLGEYEGTVSRDGSRMTLNVEGQEFRLHGPESCD